MSKIKSELKIVGSDELEGAVAKELELEEPEGFSEAMTKLLKNPQMANILHEIKEGKNEDSGGTNRS